MNIRPAVRADNDALLGLARTLSLPGIVRFGVDRGPDFFALHRMMAGETLTVVGEVDNEIVGFIDGCMVPAHVAGHQVKALEICLAGMRADHRGKKNFLLLLQDIEQRARGAGCEIGFGLTNEHNAQARAFVPAWPHGAIFCEPVGLHVIVADRRPRTSSPFAVRRATLADSPSIASLVQAHRSNYDFAPTLPRQTRGIPGLEASDFLVAINASGHIVACLALWDQTDWRRTPLVAYGFPVRALKLLGDAACVAFGRPRLPHAGEHFRFCHVAYPAAAPGAVDAFAALLRAAAGELTRRKLHFIALGLPASDPLVGALSGFLSLTMRATPFVAPANRQLADALAGRVPLRAWFEYALV